MIIPLRYRPFSLALTFICLLWGVNAVQAQSSGQAESLGVQRQVICRALAVDTIEGLETLHVLDPLGQPLNSTKLRRRAYGRPFLCTTFDNVARFGIKVGENEEGVDVYKTLLTVKISTRIDQAGLIFVPSSLLSGQSSGDDQYMVRAFDNSLRAFPLTHTLVINLLPTDISFKIGDEIREVPTGQVERVGAIRAIDGYNMADASFFFKAKDQWNSLKQTKIKYVPQVRYTSIAYFNMKAKRPDLALIRDNGWLPSMASLQGALMKPQPVR